jgi:hypothetical protein
VLVVVAENLGVAVLRIEVDTEQALKEIGAVKAAVAAAFNGIDGNVFGGLAKGAAEAGEKAGKAAAEGAKKQLKFLNVEEALSFNAGNSIKSLGEYRSALTALRDKLDINSLGCRQLNDRIQALDSAVKLAKSSTALFTQETTNLDAALNKAITQRFLSQAKQFQANLKESARASAEFAQKLLDLREKALSAGRAVAGIATKGVVEGLKVPVFGLPNSTSNALDKARAQIQRLREQSETASGKVARLSEGLAALGAGGVAAKGIIETLGGIGGVAEGVAGTLDQVRSALASLPGPLRGVGGLDEIFANGAASIQEWASSILSAQGDLSQLTGPLTAVTEALSALGPEAAAVGGALAFSFAGFQDLIAKSFKPGVDGAREALKGMTADTQLLLEALAQVSNASQGLISMRDLKAARNDAARRVEANPVGTEENRTATEELLKVDKLINVEKQKQANLEATLLLTERERLQVANDLRAAAAPPAQLALPDTALLEQQNPNRKIKRLTPPTGPVPAIDVGLQAGRNFTEELNRRAENSAMREAAERRKKEAEDRQKAAKQNPGFQQFSSGNLPTPVDAVSKSIARNQEKRAKEEERRLKQENARQKAADEQSQKLNDDLLRVKERRIATEKFTTDALQKVRKGIDAEAAAQQRAAKEAEKRTAAQKADRTRRVKDSIGSALIGGAFPALFGQGLGASAGGFAGGALGGALGGQFGFGLSLVGTQLGTAFDTAIQKSKDLAKALEDPIQNFSALQESAALSSKAVEKQVETLIAVGRGAEAAALIQEDLTRTYGGFEEAKKLASAQDELNRSWTQLQIAIAQQATPALTEIIKKFASIAGLKPVGNNAADKLGRNDYLNQLQDFGNTYGFGAQYDISGKQLDYAAELQRKGVEYNTANELANKKAIDYAKNEYGWTVKTFEQDKAAIRAEEEKNRAAERYAQLRSLAFKQLDAEIQGNQRASLLAQKNTVELERQNKLKELGTVTPANRDAAVKIENEARLQTLKINGQIAALDRAESLTKIKRASQLKALAEQISNEQQRGNLTGTGNAALQAMQSYRDAIRARDLAVEAYNRDPNSAGLLENARQAGDAVQLAAAKARTDLVEAFRAARQEAQDAAFSLNSAYTNLLQLRGGTGGVNKFLDAASRNQREIAANAQLTPLFLKAQADLGVNVDPSKLGKTLGERNQSMAEFIAAAQQEAQAVVAVSRAQETYAKAQNSLQVATEQLTNVGIPTIQQSASDVVTRLEQLIAKDWSVGVTVNRDTGAVAVSNAYQR